MLRLLLILLFTHWAASQALFIDANSQFFTSNLTNAVADNAEITRWISLCFADTRCKRFAGMSLDGSISVDTFTQMMTLAPFTQNPPTFNNGIYDVLVASTDVSAVNDELIVLKMVYAFSYISSGCAAIEIPVLIDGVMTCQPNPRINFIDPNTFDYFVIAAAVLTLVALFSALVAVLYGLWMLRKAIRKAQPVEF